MLWPGDSSAFLDKNRRLLMESNITISTHLHTALVNKHYIPESLSGLKYIQAPLHANLRKLSLIQYTVHDIKLDNMNRKIQQVL